MTMRRLLILGGTQDASRLAAAAAGRFGAALEVITSLAGRTRHPARPPGRVRTGGFGGAGGLARYLRQEGIGMLVDATHPFATRISASARAACEVAGVPRFILDRPPWTPEPGDRWVDAADLEAAAALAPDYGKRAFLALGAGGLAAFRGMPGAVVRLVDAPAAPPLEDCVVITGRGPFAEEDERRLLIEHRIDVVVSRNSGGAAAMGKISAARFLAIPVIMIKRPSAEQGARTNNVEEVCTWIERRLEETV